MTITTMTTTIVSLCPTSVLTRADHDPGVDWPEPARTLRVEAKAPERHASRVLHVEAALAALAADIVDNEAWAAEGPEAGEVRRLDINTLELSAGTVRTLRAIAAVELHGSGGRLGLYGGVTLRMSWARRFGKGRHQASDGAAWDGAIASVFGGVDENTPEPVDVVAAARLIDELDDLGFLVNYSIWRSIESHTAQESTAWTNAACRIIRVMLDDDAAASQMDGFRGLTQRVIAMGLPRSRPVVRTSDDGVLATVTYPRDEAEDEQLPLNTGRYICPITGARGMAQSTSAPTVELVARSV